MNIIDLKFYNSFIKKNSDKKLVARSLLLQGALINRYSFLKKIINSEKLKSKFDFVDNLAKKNKMKILELSISSIFSFNSIDHCIIGSTSIKNIKDNIRFSKKLINTQILSKLMEYSLIENYMTNPRKWIFYD